MPFGKVAQVIIGEICVMRILDNKDLMIGTHGFDKIFAQRRRAIQPWQKNKLQQTISFVFAINASTSASVVRNEQMSRCARPPAGSPGVTHG